MSSSTSKALPEDRGQQWRVRHCQSWGMANSTHQVTCAGMDLQVCINVTQSRSGWCKESLVLAWKCVTSLLLLSCQSTGCPSFRQSSGLKTDLNKKKKNLVNLLTKGGVMNSQILLGSLRILVPESNLLSLMRNQISWIDTGSWDGHTDIALKVWHVDFAWWTTQKGRFLSESFLSLFTFPTGRISF